MNNINITGRLTKDPELKTTSNNTKYCNFTLAVSRGKVKEGAQAVDYIPCIAWNKTAEILCNYCNKGKLLGISGKLCARQYEKDGEKKTAYEVFAMVIEMLGGNDRKPEPISTAQETIEDDGALPFEI